MGKFLNHLLCTDFDDTFVTHSNDGIIIHENNLKMSEYFMEKGGEFTLATGRSVESTRPHLPKFKVSAPAIVFNGGAIYDYNKDKVIDATYMNPIWKDYVKAILDKFPHLTIRASAEYENFAYGTKEGIEFINSIEPIRNIATKIDDIPNKCISIIFLGEQEEILEAEEFVKASNLNETTFVKSSPYLLEIIAKNVSKGKALKTLADYLNISHENTFSIGDYYNDISMLKQAGFSAAVGNAPDDVKAFANVVVGQSKDGAVGEFIKIIDEKIS